ncbi:MAG: NfeD family protein [Neomegalonema sp.]|nr:NfeD family protein [Neomegalonema sp.]
MSFIWTLDAGWVWLGVGLLLLMLELLTGSLFLIWAGLSALAISALAFAAPSIPVQLQLVLFAGVAVASTYFGRSYFRGRVGPAASERPMLNRRDQQLVGRRVLAVTDFSNGEGRVQLADSPWSARLPNDVANAVIRKGDALVIRNVEGVTLIVSPA